jgi:hypothetical protein
VNIFSLCVLLSSLYAFVNFKTPEAAASFLQSFQNYSFPGSNSKKLSYAKPARDQGYQVIVNRCLKGFVGSCLLLLDDAARVVIHIY